MLRTSVASWEWAAKADEIYRNTVQREASAQSKPPPTLALSFTLGLLAFRGAVEMTDWWTTVNLAR